MISSNTISPNMRGRDEKHSQKQPLNGSARKVTDTDGTTWTTSRIKHELELRGHTLASIARENGFHDSACRKTLRTPWPRIERILADYLGLSCPSELFPDRYHQGLPIKHQNGMGNQNACKGKPR